MSKLNYIKLTDNVLLNLSTGPIYISPKTLNYRKICSMLDTASEEDILPLMHVPEGAQLFLAYTHDNQLIVQTIDSVGVTLTFDAFTMKTVTFPSKSKHVGTYLTMEALRNDFPEYLI